MINTIENVLKWIGPNDRVLDVGGGAVVFPRANAVIDLLPYEERQNSEQSAEEFTRRDWYVSDICHRDAWSQIPDKAFDFVVCSHTLEDIRDPIYVCSQLNRVAKAGYIEFPSRFREGAKGNPTSGVSGWEHHRWIIDVIDGTLTFTMKNPFINRFDLLGNQRRDAVLEWKNAFTGVHWIGSFNYIERGQKGSPLETENMAYFYDQYDYQNPTNVYEITDVPFAGKTFEWDHQLPVEKVMTIEAVMAQHQRRLKKAGIEQHSNLLTALLPKRFKAALKAGIEKPAHPLLKALPQPVKAFLIRLRSKAGASFNK